MHIVVDVMHAETAVFVGAVVEKQATDIAVLEIDVLNGVGPAVLGDFVDHPQTVHQILHKGKLHLVRACVCNVEVIVGNDVHIALGEEIATLSVAQIDPCNFEIRLAAVASEQAHA